MREMILAAVRSGRIDDLVTAIEWNEMPPDFGGDEASDPITRLKSISEDGEGREVLAALADMLTLPPAKLHQGKDLENNAVYVWPYLAEVKLDNLKPPEQVDLLRLMPFKQAEALRASGKWRWWRLAIAADGTWLTFGRPD